MPKNIHYGRLGPSHAIGKEFKKMDPTPDDGVLSKDDVRTISEKSGRGAATMGVLWKVARLTDEEEALVEMPKDEFDAAQAKERAFKKMNIAQRAIHTLKESRTDDGRVDETEAAAFTSDYAPARMTHLARSTLNKIADEVDAAIAATGDGSKAREALTSYVGSLRAAPLTKAEMKKVRKGVTTLAGIFRQLGTPKGEDFIVDKAAVNAFLTKDGVPQSVKNVVKAFHSYGRAALDRHDPKPNDPTTANDTSEILVRAEMHQLLSVAMRAIANRNNASKMLPKTWQAITDFALDPAVDGLSANDIVGKAKAPVTVDNATKLDEWKSIDRYEREEALSWGGGDCLKSLGELTPAEIKNLSPEQQKFAKAILDDANANLPDEPDESGEFNYFGGTNPKVELFLLESGEIAGGKVSFYQEGFQDYDHPLYGTPEFDDVETWGYDTAAEVEAAGFDPHNDVNWSASDVFDHEMKSLSGGAVWSWTGH